MNGNYFVAVMLLPACVMMNYYNVVQVPRSAKRRLEKTETYHLDLINVLCRFYFRYIMGFKLVPQQETKKWEKTHSLFELLRDHAHSIFPLVCIVRFS